MEYRQGISSTRKVLLMYKILRWFPGALGFYLRQKIYPRLFHSCGRNVLFGRYIDFKQPERICIGNNVVLGDYVVLDASSSPADGCVLSIDDDVLVGMGTTLQLNPAPITIEAGASLSTNCMIQSMLPVHIGRNVLIAAYSTIGAPPVDKPDNIPQQQTEIGSGCWLGARAIITQGVRIGEGSVVGAHGLVETDLPTRVVAVGQPVEIISARQASPKNNQSA